MQYAPARENPRALAAMLLGFAAAMLLLTPAWPAAWLPVIAGWHHGHRALDDARAGAGGWFPAGLGIALSGLALAALTTATLTIIGWV